MDEVLQVANINCKCVRGLSDRFALVLRVPHCHQVVSKDASLNKNFQFCVFTRGLIALNVGSKRIRSKKEI